MPRFESDADARRLGEALAALRREAGLSQAEAPGVAVALEPGHGPMMPDSAPRSEDGFVSGLVRLLPTQ